MSNHIAFVTELPSAEGACVMFSIVLPFIVSSKRAQLCKSLAAINTNNVTLCVGGTSSSHLEKKKENVCSSSRRQF